MLIEELLDPIFKPDLLIYNYVGNLGLYCLIIYKPVRFGNIFRLKQHNSMY